MAERHDVPVVDLRLSQLEPSDLRGILFLDEINAAPPSVSAAAYQLILDRRLGE